MLGTLSIPPSVPRVELPPDLSAPKRKPNGPQKGMLLKSVQNYESAPAFTGAGLLGQRFSHHRDCHRGLEMGSECR